MHAPFSIPFLARETTSCILKGFSSFRAGPFRGFRRARRSLDIDKKNTKKTEKRRNWRRRASEPFLYFSMLPPSSSSDEGPAPHERGFERRESSKRFVQARMCPRGGDGRYSRSDDDEDDCRRQRNEVGEEVAEDGNNDGDVDDDIDDDGTRRRRKVQKQQQQAPPPPSLGERALSTSELEELGFAAHLLLKISSSPIKRPRVDLVSFTSFFFFCFNAFDGAPRFSFSPDRRFVFPFFFTAWK